ncbi:transglycosylase family protein [Streptomyces sp. NPDC091371]|uniref:transglycosylase family protein n=1 Tax=Streptomyces sp. NPDC091371 TaxID=3155303 RepID=UPI0034162002
MPIKSNSARAITLHTRARIAAAALGVATLLPLSAVQADAASVSTWDKVAQCETGGNWNHVQTGSPYYGGLRISFDIWGIYGGGQYATFPYQATKQQQILIAEKILAGQGEQAWRICGPAAGLGADRAVPYPVHKRSTAGVYRPSDQTFSVSDGSGNYAGSVTFGAQGDVPLTGDWNGDLRDTFGVYRPSDQSFYLSNVNGVVAVSRKLGNPGDVPVVGDWDGNGTDTIGVYRPSDQTFYLTNDNETVAHVRRMGVEGDTPMVGDWNGDGKDTVGVYRPSDTFFYLSDSNSTANVDRAVKFGNPGDVPIKGDWNGDGTDKVGVYRPAESDFFGAAKDSNTVIYNIRFGIPGDKPILGLW